MWGLLGFLFPNPFVQMRKSTACLNTPNCFPLRRRMVYTLSIPHELKSTMFNTLVAFPTLTTVIKRPNCCLTMDLQLTIALLCSVGQNAPHTQIL